MVDQATSTTPFAAITLSIIAYEDETLDGSPKQKKDIIEALSHTTIGAQGPWSLLWGPATNGGNLVYVALNSAKNRYGLAIRGTVTETSWSMFDDIQEDLGVLDQDDWLYPQSAAGLKIASGFDTGLDNILAVTDPVTDWSLLDFLRKAIRDAPGELLVTGHSLGGTLATVAALWLQDQLPKGGGPRDLKIIPITFAAPTAGNQAFAEHYDKTFPNSLRYVNTLDLIPMAYADLETLITNYPKPPGPALWDYSPSAYVAILVAGGILDPFYAQTNQKRGTISFQGPAPSGSNSFPEEVEIQHSTSVYRAPLVIPEPVG
jgi:triacylglycerol lipase